MAIIYTYPVKGTPAANDLILISDSADNNRTKQVKVSSLPSSGAGITLTTSGTSGPAELNGTALNIPNYSTTPSLPFQSIQFRDANGNFNGIQSLLVNPNSIPDGGATKLTVGDTGQDLAGAIEIQSDENGAILKIGGGSQTYYTSIKGSDVDTASYNIILPPAGPGGNNKILESTSTGVLSWIDTPTGGGGVATFSNANGTFVSAGTQNVNAVGAVTMGSIDLSASGTASGTTFLRGDNKWATPIGADVGFSPMSIYEGIKEVGSRAASASVTYLRQTVVENQCTINAVDFFRLDGTSDVSIHVYEGTIADSGNAQLVLSGTSSGGSENQINNLNFNKVGYSDHTFAAGASAVILVSFRLSGAFNVDILGADNLFINPNLSRTGDIYYDSASIPAALDDALDNIEDNTANGACLHFYKS
jgi:hypothetical protein